MRQLAENGSLSDAKRPVDQHGLAAKCERLDGVEDLVPTEHNAAHPQLRTSILATTSPAAPATKQTTRVSPTLRAARA